MHRKNCHVLKVEHFSLECDCQPSCVQTLTFCSCGGVEKSSRHDEKVVFLEEPYQGPKESRIDINPDRFGISSTLSISGVRVEEGIKDLEVDVCIWKEGEILDRFHLLKQNELNRPNILGRIERSLRDVDIGLPGDSLQNLEAYLETDHMRKICHDISRNYTSDQLGKFSADGVEFDAVRQAVTQREVVIYTQPDCRYCAQAVSLLDSKEILYQEIDVESNPTLREEAEKKSGITTMPQIFVDGEFFSDSEGLIHLEEDGKLNQLLGINTHYPEPEDLANKILAETYSASTVVIDFDNTLYQNDVRTQLIKNPDGTRKENPDWDSFFSPHSMLSMDTPYPDIMPSIEVIQNNFNVIVLTNNPPHMRETIRKQLQKIGLGDVELITADKRGQKTRDVKGPVLRNLASTDDLAFTIDDDYKGEMEPIYVDIETDFYKVRSSDFWTRFIATYAQEDGGKELVNVPEPTYKVLISLIPDAEAQKHFHSVRSRTVRNKYPKIIPREESHITLCFMREVTEEQLFDIGHLLRRKYPDGINLRLRIEGAGRYSNPGEKDVRVIWLAMERSPEIMELRKTVLDICNQVIGNVPDLDYYPHITLGNTREGDKYGIPKVADKPQNLGYLNFRGFTIMAGSKSWLDGEYIINVGKLAPIIWRKRR